MAAVAAHHHNMPLFTYIAHLKTVREQFGDNAAKLDELFTLELRAALIEKSREQNE